MDEAIGLPTEEAVQVALRTQQILAHESGVADTIDPLAGSYVIEALTDEVERRCRDYIQKIDELGGALAAIEAGYIQREIQEAAFQTQLGVESGDNIVVGVNEFLSEGPTDLTRLTVDPAIEQSQRLRLAQLRQQRDESRAQSLLNHLSKAAVEYDNLLPLIIECVEADLTLGEICGCLREVWGEYSVQPSL
jgi:methylmalonyl-CoA mutase N-terminal domain/subunit